MDLTTNQGRITKDTWIPLGLVITALSVAVTFGITYQKIDGLVDSQDKTSEAVLELTRSLQDTRETVISVRVQQEISNRTVVDINGDVKEIQKQLASDR